MQEILLKIEQLTEKTRDLMNDYQDAKHKILALEEQNLVLEEKVAKTESINQTLQSQIAELNTAKDKAMLAASNDTDKAIYLIDECMKELDAILSEMNSPQEITA